MSHSLLRQKFDKWLDTTESDVKVSYFILLFITGLGAYAILRHDITLHYNIINFGDINLSLDSKVNPLYGLLISYIAILSIVLIKFSSSYMRSDTQHKMFSVQLMCVIVASCYFVIADNLFTAFVGWELIGISLYFLLNHHTHDESNRAAKKKFVLVRIGDLCFLAAVILAYIDGHSTSFVSLINAEHATSITLLICVAVASKVALFPLHIWLPDTLEAPTPVSAIMHAGLINAGGILLAKISGLLAQEPNISMFLLLWGLGSGLLGAAIMRYQASVKKRLAYSTMAQMGFMVAQCGMGAFSAAIFHLMAHGFYKANLFLGSGRELLAKQASAKETNPMSLAVITRTVLISVFIAVLGILTIESLDIFYPPLLYGFLLLTIMQLLYKIQNQNNDAKTQLIAEFLILIMMISYLLIVCAIEHLAKFNIDNNWLSVSLQYTVVSIMLISQIGFWLVKDQTWKRKLSLNIQTFTVQPYTELLYRNIFVAPFRLAGQIGDKFLTPLTLAFLVITLFALIGNLAFPNIGKLSTIDRFEITFLMGCIGATIIANRSHHLYSMLSWLLIAELLLVCIAIYTGSLVLRQIGIFQLINIVGILLIAIFISIAPRQPPTSSKYNWASLYLIFSIVMMIGIPGTASFITELFIFKHFLQTSVFCSVLFAIAMLLLATTCLRILQIYVYRTRREFTIKVSPLLHILCLGLIGINLLNGLAPNLLLNLL